MTAAVKNKPAAAAPKPGPKPANPAPAPEAKAPEVPAGAKAPTKTGNSAWAAESVRNKVTQAMKDLREKGFTRPSISAVTGYTDSQVWRAQNGKVYENEVPTLLDFFERVLKGEIQPPAPARKPKVEDLQVKIDAALEALGDEAKAAKTVAQLRKVVEAAREALTA